MCGIAGVLALNGQAVNKKLITSMAGVMAHRGPDDEGYLFVDIGKGTYQIAGGRDTPDAIYGAHLSHTPAFPLDRFSSAPADLCLGSRRLAIIDLTPAGHQPMCNEDQTVWIVHNGEIYNYSELRKELEANGHRFLSNTDTEVILNAYEEWGPDCLNKFKGMWAFCIWDSRLNRLFCTRDRFGIKPFYYYWDGDVFLFASEIKALLSSGLVKPEANDPIINTYLAYGEVDQTEETFFRGVRQLRGGNYLELDLSSKNLKIYRYYNLDANRNFLELDDTDYSKYFEKLFEDAVQLHLISDVPVGTCLSGGLDSSAIVCVVDKLLREQGIKLPGSDLQRTFSARYSDLRHDEGLYIEAVAQQAEVDANFVYPTPESLAEELQQLVWHQEEPFGSTSIYAQWNVYQLAKKCGVTVTLDGQGGDEVLGGYHHYFGPHLGLLLRSLRLKDLVAEAIACRRLHGYPLWKLLPRAAYSLLPAGGRAFVRSLVAYPSWVRGQGVNHGESDSRAVYATGDPFSRQLKLDLLIRLHALLRFADRNSMAHSVEARVPFLDHRLVEFAFALPAHHKIHQGTTKIVLRNGLKGVLPDEVRTRQDKIAFSTPEDHWFRGPLKPMVLDIINSRSFQERPYFHHGKVRRVFEERLKGRRNALLDIWRCVNLELWMRRFIN